MMRAKKAFKKYKKIIEESDLFDSKYYLKHNHEARVASATPIDHFIKHGLDQDSKPNERFDPVWYRNYYEDIKKDGVYPFIHYILYGKMEKRFENGGKKEVSTESRKRSSNLNKECIYQLKSDNVEAIREGRIRFHPIFPAYNEERYLAQNEDVKKAVYKKVYKTGFEHFLEKGYNQILNGKRTYKEQK